tara:strand:- start:586 stop:1155 length:570 start_codon:yes stop_codon:yes gene_type:complete
MSKRNTRSRERLKTLRTLVEELSDRDVKIKRDMRLFEDFFKNFPIPVTIWAITKEGSVVSQRGNGIISEKAECVTTMFGDGKNKTELIDLHTTALSGKPVQKILKNGDIMYYVAIIPRRDDNEVISGAAGLAWDVTSNYTMLCNLENIERDSRELLDNSENKTTLLSSILENAQNALSKSRLAKILKGE